MRTEIRYYFTSEAGHKELIKREYNRLKEYASKKEGAHVEDHGPFDPATCLSLILDLDYQPKSGETICTDYEGMMEVCYVYTDVMTNTYVMVVKPE